MKARNLRLKQLKKEIEVRLAGDEKELEHTKNFLLKILGEVGDICKMVLGLRKENEQLKEKVENLEDRLEKVEDKVFYLEMEE